MAKTIRFARKNIKKPGAYSQIVSGVKNGFVTLPYGGLLIIDTGSGANWGGASGISGTLEKNGDAIYRFDSCPDFQAFVRGGIWWKLAETLFFPNGNNSPGISYIEYVKAAVTAPAEISMTFTGGGSAGGTLVFQTRDEGKVGNGYFGDETKASTPVAITAAGTGGDSISLVVNGSTTIGTYAVIAGNTAAMVATDLINDINSGSSGYTAVQLTATTFRVYAPANMGATGNSITIAANITGTNGLAATVTSPFAGGVTGTKLTRGYAAKMVAGTIDIAKFKLAFYSGTFKGLDTDISNGEPFDGIAEVDTNPVEVIDTPEFDNLNDLQEFITNDPTFNDFFKLKTITIVGTGAVDGTDLTSNSTLKLATGGTETYSSTELNIALDYLKTSQTSFIFLDKWGANAQHARNTTIAAWNANEARFIKEMYIGGGKTEDNFDPGDTASSRDTAVFYNNQAATVVHGGVYQPRIGGGLKTFDSVYHAGLWLGREAGLEPQVPLTQKQILISGVVHTLSEKQQDLCIDSGVLACYLDEDYDPARFVCLKGINTLQNNDNLINTDSTSASKQLNRITRQLNKELVINAKRRFFGNPNGVNRNTASIGDVTAFVQDFLGSKVATPQEDNLILDFKKIVVTVKGDAYYVTYEFEPNFEVNFFLFTGILIDPNS